MSLSSALTSCIFIIAVYLFRLYLRYAEFADYMFCYACREMDTINKSYDYIVVGLGTAGSVLARRLSEDGKAAVLALEAGAYSTSLMHIPGISLLLQKTSFDWQYKTVPQKYACKAFMNNRSTWPMGKIIGGTHMFNNMIYTRGHPNDYDYWYQNDKNYKYEDDILPYFKKLENQMEETYTTPRLKKHAVPSQFAWTKPPTESVINRAERAKRRLQLNNVIPSHSSRHTDSDEDILQPEVCSDIEISVNEVTVESSTKDVSTQSESTEKMMCNVSTNIMIERKRTNGFNILLLQSAEKQAELKYYTGFDNYNHFWLVFSILGPAVNHLIYFHSDTAKRKNICILSPVNEFLLTVMKLRRNMSNKELAFKFNISETSVEYS